MLDYIPRMVDDDKNLLTFIWLIPYHFFGVQLVVTGVFHSSVSIGHLMTHTQQENTQKPNIMNRYFKDHDLSFKHQVAESFRFWECDIDVEDSPPHGCHQVISGTDAHAVFPTQSVPNSRSLLMVTRIPTLSQCNVFRILVPMLGQMECDKHHGIGDRMNAEELSVRYLLGAYLP
jgi:hypothetical protein